jgi:hypothetical protein
MCAAVTNRSRWLRYSLRTLLIAMTAFCIWLGLTTAAARRQHKAVEAILAEGGYIAYDYELVGSKPGRAWFRQIVGDDFVISPIVVRLASDHVTDEFIEQNIALFNRLTSLNLESSNLSRRGLVSILPLRQLQSLQLISPQIKLEDLKQFNPPKSLACVRIFHSHANAAAADTLAIEKTTLECREMPLGNMLDYIRMRHQIQIWLETNSDDLLRPVTVNVKNVTIESAIRQLLKSANLNYTVGIKDGAIVITTPELARQNWPGLEMLNAMFPTPAIVDADWWHNRKFSSAGGC